MKLPLLVCCGLLALAANAAPSPRPASAITNAPQRIELKDQFEATQIIAFPTTNLTLLTIADHKGSEQIAGWVGPVREHYGLRVDIRGLADMSAVPGWLRGVVRKKFRQRQAYPVMLDWSGETVNAFAAVPDLVNVLLLDEQGRILQRFTGAVQTSDLTELFTTIDQALAGAKLPVAPK